jgi:hypothetical protein
MVKKTVTSLTHLLLNRVNGDPAKKVAFWFGLFISTATVLSILGNFARPYILEFVNAEYSNLRETVQANANAYLLLRRDVDANEKADDQLRKEISEWYKEDKEFKKDLYTRLGTIEAKLGVK